MTHAARDAATDPLPLAQRLIRCPSVTPQDHGALDVLAAALGPLGFTCRRLTFETPGTEPVDNLYARLGTDRPVLAFAGHTDVVPPGPTADWSVDPFAADIKDGVLYGRGASDMKGAIAAFVAAVGRFLAARSGGDFGGSLALLITGDEEGVAINGTVRLLEWLQTLEALPDECLVGEPTNPAALGDMIKIGRRGSLNMRLTVRGRQGHVAYPDKADNPLPRLIAMLSALLATPLDHGSDWFDPSRLEITSIDTGNAATNVIPGSAVAAVNIRFNDHYNGAALQSLIRERVAPFQPLDIDFALSGDSFLSPPGPLAALVAGAVEAVTGRRPAFSTSGGTSDARFIHHFCPVVEMGGINQTAHKIDERMSLADLEGLTRIYTTLLERRFPDAALGARHVA